MNREEKILRFAGWEFIEFEGYEKRWTYPEGKEGAWVSPDGESFLSPPEIDHNFLAEYVFPKLGVERIEWEFASNLVSCVIDAEYKAYEGNVAVTSFEEAHQKYLEACLQAVEKAIGKE